MLYAYAYDLINKHNLRKYIYRYIYIHEGTPKKGGTGSTRPVLDVVESPKPGRLA